MLPPDNADDGANTERRRSHRSVRDMLTAIREFCIDTTPVAGDSPAFRRTRSEVKQSRTKLAAALSQSNHELKMDEIASSDAVQQWEEDSRQPNLATLQRYALIAGTPLGLLFIASRLRSKLRDDGPGAFLDDIDKLKVLVERLEELGKSAEKLHAASPTEQVISVLRCWPDVRKTPLQPAVTDYEARKRTRNQR